ncbi:MAG: helix-turn-helix domain-containing protein [Thermomicrobiales bacterium]
MARVRHREQYVFPVGDTTVTLEVARPMTAEEWEQMMELLALMRHSLVVRDEVDGKLATEQHRNRATPRPTPAHDPQRARADQTTLRLSNPVEIDGDRLRQARMAAHLRHSDVYQHSGIRPATMSRLERGKQSRVRMSTIQRLAEAIGVEPWILLKRSTDANS